MVERFEFTCPDCDPDKVSVNHGRYVRHSDYAALQSELETVKKQRDYWQAQHDERTRQLGQAAEAKLAGGEAVRKMHRRAQLSEALYQSVTDTLKMWRQVLGPGRRSDDFTLFSFALADMEKAKARIDARLSALTHPVPTHNDGSGALPDDLFSHRAAWRKALELARDSSPEPEPDMDDRAYWQHEIDVFDKVYAALSHTSGEVTEAWTDRTFRLRWMAAPRLPVHPSPMEGRQVFSTFDEALAFMAKQAPDAEFLSLEERSITTIDRSNDARAVLRGDAS